MKRILKQTCRCLLLGAALLRQGRRLAGLSFDTMLAAYLLNPLASGYELGRLAQEYAVEGDPAAEPIRLLPEDLRSAVADKEFQQLLHAKGTSIGFTAVLDAPK